MQENNNCKAENEFANDTRYELLKMLDHSNPQLNYTSLRYKEAHRNFFLGAKLAVDALHYSGMASIEPDVYTTFMEALRTEGARYESGRR